MAEKKKSKAIYALLGLGLLAGGIAVAFSMKDKTSAGKGSLKVIAKDPTQYPVNILIETDTGEFENYLGNVMEDKSIPLESGDYIISISKLGYVTEIGTVQIIEGKETTATFVLNKVAEGCSQTNLPGCGNQVDCETANGFWYNNQCNKDPIGICAIDNLPSCANQLDCETVGGFWYNGMCNAEPPTGFVKFTIDPFEASPAHILIVEQMGGKVVFDGNVNDGEKLELPSEIPYILSAQSTKAGYKDYPSTIFSVQTTHTIDLPYEILISLPKLLFGCVNFSSNVSGFSVEIIGGGVWNLSCGGQTCQQCNLPIAEGEFNQYLYTATKSGYTTQTGGFSFPPGIITANITITLSPVGGTVTFEITDNISNKPLEFALIYVDTAYKGQTDGNGKLTVDLSAGSHKAKVTKQGYEDANMNFSLADGQNKTVPIDMIEIAPKKEVLVVYPYYAINNNGNPCTKEPWCCEASPTDKELSLSLYNTLKTKSKINAQYGFATSLSDLFPDFYDVVIMIGGSWAWNNCNSWYAGEPMMELLGFSDTTATKSTWCNSKTLPAGAKVYQLGGFTANNTQTMVNCFKNQLNADGSNIDSISCSTVEGCA